MPFFVLFVGIIIFIAIKGACYRDNPLRYMFKSDDKGEISPYKAVMTSLAGSMGIGNIIGVSQALMIGGPGSIFWMWVSAFFGSAIKFAEGALATKYGDGPLSYIQKTKVAFMAPMFAIIGILACLGMGNMVQANSISLTIKGSPWIVGSVLLVLTFIIISRGIKGISDASAKIILVMTFVFLLSSLVALGLNYQKIYGVFVLIFKEAFRGTSILGGGMFVCIKIGLSRGLFSNEAGMGVTGFAHSASNNKSPYRAGILAAIDPIVDTIIFCTIVALVILCANMSFKEVSDIDLCLLAYQSILGDYGGLLIFLSILIYGFATIISWYYYGEKCYLFLFRNKRVFMFIFLVVLFCGCFFRSRFVWQYSDICNYLMTFPNLFAIICLLPTLRQIARKR